MTTPAPSTGLASQVAAANPPNRFVSVYLRHRRRRRRRRQSQVQRPEGRAVGQARSQQVLCITAALSSRRRRWRRLPRAPSKKGGADRALVAVAPPKLGGHGQDRDADGGAVD
jgi:hypothetical protein